MLLVTFLTVIPLQNTVRISSRSCNFSYLRQSVKKAKNLSASPSPGRATAVPSASPHSTCLEPCQQLRCLFGHFQGPSLPDGTLSLTSDPYKVTGRIQTQKSKVVRCAVPFSLRMLKCQHS